MNQTQLGYDQSFYIDGTKIVGVQSVNGSYSISEKPINIIGYGHVDNFFNKTCNPDTEKEYPRSLAVVNSPLQGSFSVESMLISEDFFMPKIGDHAIVGSLFYGPNASYYGFSDGYITSHTVNCTIGQIPTTSTQFTVYGEQGGSPDYIIQEQDRGRITQETEYGIVDEDSYLTDIPHNATGKAEFPDIGIPNQGSIYIQCTGAESNRVTSFTHTVNVQHDAIYAVGENKPVQVDVVWPITTQTNFTLEVDKYKYQKLREYLVNPVVQDISIKIDDCFGNNIENYNIGEARLLSESMSSSVEGRLTVDLTYTSYINQFREKHTLTIDDVFI